MSDENDIYHRLSSQARDSAERRALRRLIENTLALDSRSTWQEIAELWATSQRDTEDAHG